YLAAKKGIFEKEKPLYYDSNRKEFDALSNIHKRTTLVTDTSFLISELLLRAASKVKSPTRNHWIVSSVRVLSHLKKEETQERLPRLRAWFSELIALDTLEPITGLYRKDWDQDLSSYLTPDLTQCILRGQSLHTSDFHAYALLGYCKEVLEIWRALTPPKPFQELAVTSQNLAQLQKLMKFKGSSPFVKMFALQCFQQFRGASNLLQDYEGDKDQVLKDLDACILQLKVSLFESAFYQYNSLSERQQVIFYALENWGEDYLSAVRRHETLTIDHLKTVARWHEIFFLNIYHIEKQSSYQREMGEIFGACEFFKVNDSVQAFLAKWKPEFARLLEWDTYEHESRSDYKPLGLRYYLREDHPWHQAVAIEAPPERNARLLEIATTETDLRLSWLISLYALREAESALKEANTKIGQDNDHVRWATIRELEDKKQNYWDKKEPTLKEAQESLERHTKESHFYEGQIPKLRQLMVKCALTLAQTGTEDFEKHKPRWYSHAVEGLLKTGDTPQLLRILPEAGKYLDPDSRQNMRVTSSLCEVCAQKLNQETVRLDDLDLSFLTGEHPLRQDRTQSALQNYLETLGTQKYQPKLGPDGKVLDDNWQRERDWGTLRARLLILTTSMILEAHKQAYKSEPSEEGKSALIAAYSDLMNIYHTQFWSSKPSPQIWKGLYVLIRDVPSNKLSADLITNIHWAYYGRLMEGDNALLAELTSDEIAKLREIMLIYRLIEIRNSTETYFSQPSEIASNEEPLGKVLQIRDISSNHDDSALLRALRLQELIPFESDLPKRIVLMYAAQSAFRTLDKHLQKFAVLAFLANGYVTALADGTLPTFLEELNKEGNDPKKEEEKKPIDEAAFVEKTFSELDKPLKVLLKRSEKIPSVKKVVDAAANYRKSETRKDQKTWYYGEDALEREQADKLEQERKFLTTRTDFAKASWEFCETIFKKSKEVHMALLQSLLDYHDQTEGLDQLLWKVRCAREALRVEENYPHTLSSDLSVRFCSFWKEIIESIESGQLPKSVTESLVKGMPEELAKAGIRYPGIKPLASATYLAARAHFNLLKYIVAKGDSDSCQKVSTCLYQPQRQCEDPLFGILIDKSRNHPTPPRNIVTHSIAQDTRQMMENLLSVLTTDSRGEGIESAQKPAELQTIAVTIVENLILRSFYEQ
ncbi:MAG: hypothetical protein K2Y18_06015, partial [Alphaproteobacteria bacterium]|nr:hypothetical protein [Alphaproteobacteria bacterium]